MLILIGTSAQSLIVGPGSVPEVPLAGDTVRRLGELSTVRGGELQPPYGLFDQVSRQYQLLE